MVRKALDWLRSLSRLRLSRVATDEDRAELLRLMEAVDSQHEARRRSLSVDARKPPAGPR